PHESPARLSLQARTPTPRPDASVRLSTSPPRTRTSRLRDPSPHASASVAPAAVAASTVRRTRSSSSAGSVIRRLLLHLTDCSSDFSRVALPRTLASAEHPPVNAAAYLCSYGRAPDGDATDTDVPLAGPDGRCLSRLAAEARLHLEVRSERIDPGQRVQAVADQGGTAT